MRHVIGFAKKISEQPFHIVETDSQSPPFAVGQAVKIEAAGGWFQIYQIGTRVYPTELYTTLIVGDLPPAGVLSDGEDWSNAYDWTDTPS
ncbi:hypothetical protein [Rhizobium sp. SYY.PMSO]|uniref:hypothetical protein n=1 Tax=Rhizobium sp. SYY.PMSO TaxID=3382192 RepID=UPI000DD73B79